MSRGRGLQVWERPRPSREAASEAGQLLGRPEGDQNRVSSPCSLRGLGVSVVGPGLRASTSEPRSAKAARPRLPRHASRVLVSWLPGFLIGDASSLIRAPQEEDRLKAGLHARSRLKAGQDVQGAGATGLGAAASVPRSGERRLVGFWVAQKVTRTGFLLRDRIRVDSCPFVAIFIRVPLRIPLLAFLSPTSAGSACSAWDVRTRRA